MFDRYGDAQSVTYQTKGKQMGPVLHASFLFEFGMMGGDGRTGRTARGERSNKVLPVSAHKVGYERGEIGDRGHFFGVLRSLHDVRGILHHSFISFRTEIDGLSPRSTTIREKRPCRSQEKDSIASQISFWYQGWPERQWLRW